MFNEKTIQQVRAKHDALKQKALKKYRDKGLYENFGQKEVRELQDYIGGDIYSLEGASEVLTSFNRWAMNFTGE